MTRYLLTIIFLCLISASCFTQGFKLGEVYPQVKKTAIKGFVIEKGVHDVRLPMTRGKTWPMQISVPTIPKGEKLPLIIALHWAGDSNSYRDYSNCLAFPALEFLNAIIVAPSDGGGHWMALENEHRLMHLIDQVKKYWPVDPHKVLVTGYSNGGIGSWFYAMQYPEVFSAAIPVAGIYFDEKVDVPLYVIHGEKDDLFKLEQVEKMIRTSREKGSRIELFVLKDLTHYEGCAYRDELEKILKKAIEEVFDIPKQGNGKEVDESLKYFGLDPPGDVPEIFAPGLISKEGRSEFGSVFSKDGTEFFFAVDTNERAEIRFSKLENGIWKYPETIISHEKFSFNDPFLSNDEEALYFISDRPLIGIGAKSDHDIWYVESISAGWSDPKNAGAVINSSKNEYYMSFTDDGSMFFGSNRDAEKDRGHDFDIFEAKIEAGRYKTVEKLGPTVNSRAYEADVFIAPDQSYLIFSSFRRSGLGEGDLYISFKNEDGTWSQSKNMGGKINSEGHELCPFVTKDGEYFFYTSNKNIYWVDAKIIATYR